MNASQIHPRSMASGAQEVFRTAVSLHSHTLHSRESLSFIQKAASTIGPVAFAIGKLASYHRRVYGTDLDLIRGWWTPPLGAREAWLVEKKQIECELGLRPLISLTDHDSIDAPSQLRVLTATCDVPISVEWTVPYKQTVFHIGVHNLPPPDAAALMETMHRLTRSENAAEISALLRHLNSCSYMLIVFNHPLWDESGAGTTVHRALAIEFLAGHRDCVHALELNGLRPARENRLVAEWANEVDIALVSGGDRHGREPNACLNLTKAETFEEFVEEVRDGLSQIALMPQYDEPHGLRVTYNVYDILRHDDRHSLGWRRWSDRIFYSSDDGTIRSLTQMWGYGGLSIVRYLVELIGLIGHSQIRGMLRAMPERNQVL